MSDIDYDAARALCDAATPGPWLVHDMDTLYVGNGEPGNLWRIVYATGDRMSDLTPEAQAQHRADAVFIAAARDLVPALLAEVERLRAVGDREVFAHEVIVARIAAERDKARAEVESLRLALGVTEELDSQSQRQRDEARAEVEKLQRIISDMQQAVGSAAANGRLSR